MYLTYLLAVNKYLCKISVQNIRAKNNCAKYNIVTDQIYTEKYSKDIRNQKISEIKRYLKIPRTAKNGKEKQTVS